MATEVRPFWATYAMCSLVCSFLGYACDDELRFNGVGGELLLSPALIDLAERVPSSNGEQPLPSEATSVTLAIQGIEENRFPAEGAHVDVCIGPCGSRCRKLNEARAGDPKDQPAPIDPTPYARFVQTPLDSDGRGCTVRDADHLARCVLPVSGVATLVIESKGKKYHGAAGSLFVEAVALKRDEPRVWTCARSELRTGALLPNGVTLTLSPSNESIHGSMGSVACGQFGACGGRVRRLSMIATLGGDERRAGRVTGTASVWAPTPGAEAWLTAGSCEDSGPSQHATFLSIAQHQTQSSPFSLCSSGQPGERTVTARLDPEYESGGSVPIASTTITDHGNPSGLIAEVGEQAGSASEYNVTLRLVNCVGTEFSGIRGTYGGLPVNAKTVVDPQEGRLLLEWPTGESGTSLSFRVASRPGGPVVLPVELPTGEACAFTIRGAGGQG